MPTPKFQRRKDDRPAEITAAALAAFAENGYAATRVDDVAKRAGVSKGLLYLYFKTKEELFKAVIRSFVAPKVRELSAIVDASDLSAEEFMRVPFLAMIKTLPDKFVVFVDMRDMELLPPESRPIMIEGQRYYRANGMQRSVVILKDKITMMQFKGIAKETGIYEWERYIDSNAEPNWKQVAMAWILDNIDPDDKSKTEKVACDKSV